MNADLREEDASVLSIKKECSYANDQKDENKTNSDKKELLPGRSLL